MDTAARIEAAKARLEENKAALAAVAGKAGPPCTRCRYYVEPYNNPNKKLAAYKLPECSHPVHWRAVYSEITGRIGSVAAKPVTAVEARSAERGLCGPEGLLFEHGGIVAEIAHNWPLIARWGALWVLTAGAAGAAVDLLFLR